MFSRCCCCCHFGFFFLLATYLSSSAARLSARFAVAVRSQEQVLCRAHVEFILAAFALAICQRARLFLSHSWFGFIRLIVLYVVLSDHFKTFSVFFIVNFYSRRIHHSRFRHPCVCSPLRVHFYVGLLHSLAVCWLNNDNELRWMTDWLLLRLLDADK